MLESSYQSKIIKSIEALGGVVVNGSFSKTGEADLQCGWPIKQRELTDAEEYDLIVRYGTVVLDDIGPKLIHLAVEVKTEKDYHRVMKCINADYTLNGKTGLKEHEPMQMAKIRRNRKLGGLALVAYSFKQVKEYVDANYKD